MGFFYFNKERKEMHDHLFLPLPGSNQITCKIQPVVIFSILDHHNRRKQDQYCVIGTLLGKYTDNGVEIISAFAIPHAETEEELDIDMEYHRTMLDLHQKANPNEVVVGWYSSASVIDENSVTIHNLYWKEMNQSPIHLTVDSELYGGRMEIQPYVSEQLGNDDAEDEEETENDNVITQQFFPIDFELDTSECEQGCLSALFQTKEQENRSFAIQNQSNHIKNSLQSLLGLLNIITGYVDDVVEGKKPGDKNIGRILSECISYLPQFPESEFNTLFNSQVQDNKAIIQLAELTETQLRLAEKLQATF